MKKMAYLLCAGLFSSILASAQLNTMADIDTTTRNSGLPNYGRTILLADSVAQKRIKDSLQNKFVTLDSTQTITAPKIVSPAITGAGAAVSIAPSFTLTSPSQCYGLDVADPTIINPNGYTHSSQSARFRGSIIVDATADVGILRTNQIMRGGDVVFEFMKSGSANVPTQLLFRSNNSSRVTSNLINSVNFYDSVFFSANTTAEGYSQVRITPILKQTGYTGTTRGLYVNSELTDITDFRAVQTNVAAGNGYQFFAAGSAPSLFNGDIISPLGVFRGNNFSRNSDLNPLFFVTPSSNNLTSSMTFQLTQAATPARLGGNVKAAITLNYPFFTTSGTANYAALKLTDTINQTGTSTGVTRGLFIAPTLLSTAGYRGFETKVDVNTNTFQIYAGGTAPSYFAGSIGIGTSNPQTALAVNGDITAKKVKVTLLGWSDYVFDSSYQLAPLNQVEDYISKNKHLPGIPSAVTVEKNGIDLGDNQALLLKKIEELTLYIIAQEKRIKQLEEKTK